MKKPVILIGLIVGGLVGLGVVAAVGWYLASPLFIDNVVDEDFPVEVPSPEELAQMSQAELDAMEFEVLEAAAKIPAKVMEEPMPAVADAPAIVVQGQFQDADSFHQGSGLATVYQLPDGEQVLRFEDFSATNGPDLHVLLAEHPAPASRAEVMEGYIDLGSLKGNIGNQNYEIPAGTDISQYKSIVIYCMPFHVVFATASLN
jgi:hypothetical protein